MDNDKNEKLIKKVQDLAKKLGRTPKKREFKHYSAAAWRFGTWNNFIKAAGLTPLKEFDLTLEDYKKIIRNYVKEHGRTPTKKDFDDNIYLPDTRTIERKFGKTWNKILVDLGYEPNIRMNDFSDMTNEEILSMVKSELERIGSTTIVDYMNNRNDFAPSVRFLTDRLGMKWNEILKILGFEVNVEQRSKEEWLQLLKDVAADLGKTPSVNDLVRYGLNDTVYKLNFGTWNNAIREAGLDVVFEKNEVVHTKEELLQMYIDLCGKLGRAATSSDINRHLLYKSDVFAIRFGGLQNLRDLAGSPEGKKQNKKYTKKEIQNRLIEQYELRGRRLTNSELNQLSKNNDSFPSISSILRYFRTTKISEVWDEIERELI